MAIIATVGRRSFGVLTLIGTMYFLLTVGGISMVYPFLLMLATATTTENDMQEYRLIPAYYIDDNALYRKYLWLRYDTGVAGAGARDYKRAYPGSEVSRFRCDEYFGWPDEAGQPALGNALPPGARADDPAGRQRADDLDRFLRESASLWPGPPLTEAVTDADGRTRRQYVTDPHGRPLDPGGLTTGLGNMYRTIGYIGAVYTGLSGPGRDQWPDFLDRYYGDPSRGDEPQSDRLDRAAVRHGRPYQRWRQARPGYDMPSVPSWSIIEGEYVQADWLYYKAVWCSGAPVASGSAGPGELGQPAGVSLGLPTGEYTDALGRTRTWAGGECLRALRPTLIAAEFAWDLKAAYGTIEQFNLAMGLARVDWDSPPHAGRRTIVPSGRDVVVAGTIDGSPLGVRKRLAERGLVALVRVLFGRGGRGSPATQPATAQTVPDAGGESDDEQGSPVRYLLPPQVSVEWAKLAGPFGLDADVIARLNDWLDRQWVATFHSHGYRVVHLAPFKDFDEVYLSSRRPIYEPLAREWDKFVSLRVPRAMIQRIGCDPTSQPAEPGPEPPSAGSAGRFIFDAAGDHLRLPIHAWRDFLGYLYRQRPDEYRRLYLGGQSEQEAERRVARGRAFYGVEYDRFSLAPMPIADRDVREFHTHKNELRRHFILGNFRVVFDELVLEGRAMFNTIVLIFLAIATHITVNPLAAYALSRFRLTYTYKVLLFMLATMAFPPAVGMIPAFLLLKNFSLINTYAALVLPGIASGYTIFLLKGFFDALPQELYEAAEIDGAGKVTTFLNVTFPLSKPIFAIITLGSFTAAYSGFMWAFLICPDERMWTVMVHLFNIQQRAGAQAGIAMAALVIAAIPTFLVFLFCQNVILRGIIVPSFK